jgi:PAS domain S-box-containing protein
MEYVVPLYEDPAFYELLLSSYTRLLHAPLAPELQGMAPAAGARWLYESAPFAVLAHNTDPDPCFVYGNRAAQERFGYSWEEITQLRSAEAPAREEREAFLERVRRLGYETGYRGVRIMKNGKRFIIEQATLWQLIDDQGVLHGQAVIIPATRDL